MTKERIGPYLEDSRCPYIYKDTGNRCEKLIPCDEHKQPSNKETGENDG